MEEARLWYEWREKTKQKRADAERLLKLSEEELANALDAAGKVYTFGTGVNNCMWGKPVPSRYATGPRVHVHEHSHFYNPTQGRRC